MRDHPSLASLCQQPRARSSGRRVILLINAAPGSTPPARTPTVLYDTPPFSPSPSHASASAGPDDMHLPLRLHSAWVAAVSSGLGPRYGSCGARICSDGIACGRCTEYAVLTESPQKRRQQVVREPGATGLLCAPNSFDGRCHIFPQPGVYFPLASSALGNLGH